MPNPSQVSAQNINTELNKTTTSILSLNSANTRNVAVKSSGEISYGNCRWGINFPGGEMDQISYTPNYDINEVLYITSVNNILYDGFSSVGGNSGLEFYANGVFRMSSGGLGVTNYYHRTWLTSGAAGDYTVQFQMTYLAETPGLNFSMTGAAANTDHVMSTDRVFYFASGSAGPSVEFKQADVTGNIIIKSGGTLIDRPFSTFLYGSILGE